MDALGEGWTRPEREVCRNPLPSPSSLSLTPSHPSLPGFPRVAPRNCVRRQSPVFLSVWKKRSVSCLALCLCWVSVCVGVRKGKEKAEPGKGYPNGFGVLGG